MALRRPSGLILYTAQDVARFCEVDLKTVHHWADKGKVACFRTEGRHLRFRRNDLVRFLRAHGYPMPDSVARARASVALAALGEPDLAKKLGARFTVRRHTSAIGAIASMLSEQPDAVVFALDDVSLGGAHAIGALKAAPETAWPMLAALAADEAGAAAARSAGADLALPMRDAQKLPAELARLLAVT
ncbi:MAG TPA: helix-turn-helix domain-containing protein [Labilithrix sp.]|jgi:excisionase family DNA binding protein